MADSKTLDEVLAKYTQHEEDVPLPPGYRTTGRVYDEMWPVPSQLEVSPNDLIDTALVPKPDLRMRVMPSEALLREMMYRRRT